MVRARGGRGDLGFQGLSLLLLLDLEQERAVDVRQHTSKGDGGADEGIELFVAADGQLEMARRDALDLEVLGCVLHLVVSGRIDGGKQKNLRRPIPALRPSGIRARP